DPGEDAEEEDHPADGDVVRFRRDQIEVRIEERDEKSGQAEDQQPLPHALVPQSRAEVREREHQKEVRDGKVEQRPNEDSEEGEDDAHEDEDRSALRSQATIEQIEID